MPSFVNGSSQKSSEPIIEIITWNGIEFHFAKIGKIVICRLDPNGSKSLSAQAWTVIGTLTKCLFEGIMSVSTIQDHTFGLQVDNGQLKLYSNAISSPKWLQGTGIALASEQ